MTTTTTTMTTTLTATELNDLLSEYANRQKYELIARQIFIKFGGIYESDYDDFYSIANEQLWQSAKTYNPALGVPFEAFLTENLKRKFASSLRDRNRNVRKANGNHNNVSLDTPSPDGEETLANTLPSKVNIEEDFLEDKEPYSEKTLAYLEKLSKLEKEILFLMANEQLKPEQIAKKLHISEKKVKTCIEGFRSFNNVKILLS